MIVYAIEAIEPQSHAEELFPLFHNPGFPRLWDFLRDGPFDSSKGLAGCLSAWVALPHVRGVVFRDPSHGALRGMAGIHERMVREHPTLPDGEYKELSFVVFDPAYHRTGVALAAVQQLIEIIITEKAINGYLWRCDIKNVASARFAEKLGFTPYDIAPDGSSKGMPRFSRFFHLLTPSR